MIRLVTLFAIGTSIFIFTLNSCTNNNKETLLGSICDTTDTKFATVVNPVITSKCISCHSDASQSGGINLEGYDNVKANYVALLSTMKDGSMPKGSDRIDDCIITKIQTWVNRGAQNN